VRKIQRSDLVLSFMVVALAATIATAASGNYAALILQTFLRSSFFFFAFVMLTEPLTAPPNRARRIFYGALVGLLFAPNIHIWSFYFTPELALLIGNAFSYIASPKGRFMLVLAGTEMAAKDIYDFVFTPDRNFSFLPGQYLEWTLGHHYPDNRGNRRYFTIASSPTENNIRLGVKFYPQSSTFKRALASMKIGDKISTSHLAGSFVLPKDPNAKLAFVAGGIGVTPFRAMIQCLLDKKEVRPIVMLYSNRMAEDVAYREVFDRAKGELGIKTVYALTAEKAQVPGMYNGSVDAGLIKREIPDYQERIFYLSGPRAMVEKFKKTLRGMGVSRFKIKSDFFPGFA
jgi:glycine betaine catabolism B